MIITYFGKQFWKITQGEMGLRIVRFEQDRVAVAFHGGLQVAASRNNVDNAAAVAQLVRRHNRPESRVAHAQRDQRDKGSERCRQSKKLFSESQ